MSGGAVIIIIDPQRVRSNKARKATIEVLREALEQLEAGAIPFTESSIQASVRNEDDED